MHIAALFIGTIMAVLTVMMVRERILMKKYDTPGTTAAVLYDASMALGLAAAVLSGVWLLLAFNSVVFSAVVIIGMFLLAGFTILMGITMVAVCNAGMNLRAERQS